LNYMQNVLRKIIEIDFSDKIKALFPDFASKSLDVLESEFAIAKDVILA